MLIDVNHRFLFIKGSIEGNLDFAHSLLDDGFSIDEVVELTGLSKDVILDSK